MVGRQLGDYKILSLIGKGGMGEVYLARQVHLSKEYAVKVLSGDLLDRQGSMDRFRTEARLMAGLKHPNLVEVVYMGQCEGVDYLVMEYITGPGDAKAALSLHDYLKLRGTEPVPEPEARRWLAQVAQALQVAHEAGVIHRDLKPANILIDARNNARLTDFGVAKVRDDNRLVATVHRTVSQATLGHGMALAQTMVAPGGEGAQSAATEVEGRASAPSRVPSRDASGIVGTFMWMAPEQKACGAVDYRADIYAWGMLAYRMITGRMADIGMDAPSRAVEGINPGWDAIIFGCIKPNPDDRFASMQEVLDRLSKLERAPEAALAQVTLLASAGSFAEALERLAALAGEFPGDARLTARETEVRQMQAQAGDAQHEAEEWLSAGKLAEGMQALERLIAITPQHTKARARLEDVRRSLEQRRRWREAEDMLARGDYARALGVLEPLEREYPQDEKIKRALAKARRKATRSHGWLWWSLVGAVLVAGAVQAIRAWDQRARGTGPSEPAPLATGSQPRQATAPSEPLVIVNSVGMRLVKVPAGTFMMGSPEAEKNRSAEETQHEVTLSKPFWMQTTEVTRKQWAAVMGSRPAIDKGDDLPVEQVSWSDVQDFLKKLNEKERAAGRTYRLPTEAEWEYACRAGTNTRFHSGDADKDLDSVAWHAGNSDNKIRPVGLKEPNAWGLYDMHGNAWEWCQDWQGSYPSGAVTDPPGPANGVSRVLRGGACGSYPEYCRTASRNGLSPASRNPSVGFRVLCVPGGVD